MSDDLQRARAAQRRDDLTGYLWISPWVFGFLAFMVLPVSMSLYYSLTQYPLIEKPVFIGLENYRRLMADGVFWKVVFNTVIYAVFAVPIGTVLALLIAWLLNQNVRFLGLWRAAVFVPTLVPIVAAAMIWLWLFNAEHGLINRVLMPALATVNLLPGVELSTPAWLTDPGWAMPALILMSFWGVGQAVVIYLAAMQDVPESLYEAAELDGVSPWGRFIHVTVPMISPMILFTVITAIIGAWQVFAVPYIMTGGGPDRATYFYTMYLYDKAFLLGPEMGYASAMAWIQLLIIMFFTALVFLASKRLVFYRAG